MIASRTVYTIVYFDSQSTQLKRKMKPNEQQPSGESEKDNKKKDPKQTRTMRSGIFKLRSKRKLFAPSV